jgi:hypothetical protein
MKQKKTKLKPEENASSEYGKLNDEDKWSNMLRIQNIKKNI